MHKEIKSEWVAFGGILTTLTVVFQAAPILLPTIGLLISPWSSLSVAIAAVKSKSLGPMVFIASFLLLPFISLEEAILFLTTTGPLGLTIGLFLNRIKFLITVLLASFILTGGILLLIYTIALPSFATLSTLLTFPLLLLLILSFSTFYAFLSSYTIYKLIHAAPLKQLL